MTAEIGRALSLLHPPGDIVEVRMLNTSRGTVSGYYDDLDKLVRDVTPWNGTTSVYITLNPFNPALLARANNRLVEYVKNTTTDSDILSRRWLPIDFDPVRPAGISSTNEEHHAALERAAACRKWFTSQGWPDGIGADSGNGAHLLYRIDLDNTTENRSLMERFLKALDLLFSDSVVQVDRSPYNAARIWKLYGTDAVKGDPTPDRPHRTAKLCRVPHILEIVPRELLESVAVMLPKESKSEAVTRGAGANSGAEFELSQWITKHSLPVASDSEWNGGHKWILNPCPWDPSHTNRAAYIVQFSNGAIAAGCHHNGCARREWRDLRALYEPNFNQRTPPSIPTEGKSRLGVVCLADVKPEKVSWLWGRRIAFGKLALIDGDPELGKSTLTLDIAARLTIGAKMPGIDVALEPASVILLTAEDGLSDTVRPRLEAAGADLQRIHAIRSVFVGDGQDPPSLPRDIDAIEEHIHRLAARLVIIDPLMAYLAEKVNSHNDQDVRRVLSRLADLAERTATAIVIIRHLNKTRGGPAMYRGGGSIGIVGAARTALLVARHPDDESVRVLATIKNNLSAHAQALTFRLEGPDDGAARLVWGDPCELTANALLALNPNKESHSSAQSIAEEFLREFLAEGPMPTHDVKREADRAAISIRTLERARSEIGIVSRKVGFGKDSAWYLALPEVRTPPKSAIDRQPHHMAENEKPGGLWAGTSDNLDTLRICIVTEGSRRGWPPVFFTTAADVENDSLSQWPAGKSEWRNRSERADEHELAAVWRVLQATGVLT